MENQVRELRSAETANKVCKHEVNLLLLLILRLQFKMETLSQQLSLAQAEAQRASSDLTAKTEEFANYRRAKHAELAKLQMERDSLAQQFSALDTAHKALQSSHESQGHRLEEVLSKAQDLEDQLTEKDVTYAKEAANLKRLVEMMEQREAAARAIVEKIEQDWNEVGEKANRREADLQQEIDAQRARAEEAENRVADLQKIFDRLDRGEFLVPVGMSASVPSTPARGFGTPSVNGTPDFLTAGMVGLSPTVAIASRAQRGGKTFTEVYADYVKLQEELAKKTAECDHMDRTLSQVLTQIEERVSAIHRRRTIPSHFDISH